MRIPAVLTLLLTSLSYASVQAAEGPTYLGPYSLEIVNEYGVTLPTFAARGKTYLLGTVGERYFIRVRNGSGQRIEVVASVDGRDVLDGQPADFSKRGYVVNPYQDATIDGYRLSQKSVAAFRFSSVPQSYAAQTGSARDVGVIGVAIFPERYTVPYWPVPVPQYRAVPPGGYDYSRRGTAETAPPPSSPQGVTPPDDAAKSNEAPRSVEGGVVGGVLPRPGLGTEFAEEHASHVYRVRFERASATPAALLSVHYDDRAGLVALGVDVDRAAGSYGNEEPWPRESAQPFRRNASFAQPPPGWRR